MRGVANSSVRFVREAARLGRPEHSHQTLCRPMGDFAQFGKAYCRVNEIAKDNLSGFHIAGKKILNPLAQERLAKTSIALNARPDSLFKISRQSHAPHLSVPFRCLFPATGHGQTELSTMASRTPAFVSCS